MSYYLPFFTTTIFVPEYLRRFVFFSYRRFFFFPKLENFFDIETVNFHICSLSVIKVVMFQSLVIQISDAIPNWTENFVDETIFISCIYCAGIN